MYDSLVRYAASLHGMAKLELWPLLVLNVASMMRHCPCKRDLSESCDIGVLSTVRHDCLCNRDLPESCNTGVASMISLDFVVVSAMNLMTSYL